MKTLLVTLGIFSALFPALQGQSADTVKTQILTYAPGGLPDSFEAFYRDKEGIRKWEASEGNLGHPIAYHGPRRFVLRKSEAEFSEANELPPLAAINLPEGALNTLLVSVVGKDGTVKIAAYDISTSKLKEGEYRVFNFSRSRLGVRLGEHAIALEPGRDQVMGDQAWQDKPLAFQLNVATVTEGKPDVVVTSLWEHYPRSKRLLFLFDGQSERRPVRLATFVVSDPP